MKKILACVLTFAMVLTLITPRIAFAKSEQKIKLEQVIDTTKKLLDINTDNYDFNYSYNESENGIGAWYLNWNSKKANGGGINVSVNSETGDIMSFNNWEPYTGTNTVRIPKYSKANANDEAVKFINKVAPSKFSQLVLKDNSDSMYDMSIYSDTYSFNYVRQVNGLDFPENGISINIDKNTLKIRNYSLNWDDATFTDPSKAMSLDEAKRIFADKLGIELSYNLITDSTTKTQTPILVYSLKNGSNSIDAITGEIIQNSYGLGSVDAAAKSAAAYDMKNLTPEEQKTVDTSNNYISRDAALAEAKKYITIDSDAKLSYSNLYVSDLDKSATWNFSWDKSDMTKQTYNFISASINAITGKISSFSMDGNSFYPDKDVPISYTTEQAVAVAEKFLNSIEPDKFKMTVARNNPNQSLPEGSKISKYNFSYVAKINGATCDFDTFDISVNAYTGNVMSYSTNWKDVTLPVTDKAIKLDEAYNALYKNAKLSLKYVKSYDYTSGGNAASQIKLGYVLEGFSGMLDANTGTYLDYNGKPVVDKISINYSDIKGNSAENEINILVDLGIIDDNGKTYNPDGAILQKDFIKMLVKSLGQNYIVNVPSTKDSTSVYDTYYDTAIQKNIITESEKNPEAAITRQDAARFIIRAMGIGYIGEVSNMFNLQFKDNALITDNYKGYAELAVALKIIDPIDGNFDGTKVITRGQSASIIVNYLKVDTSK